ncbi:hypothetical protein Rhopal_000519-T1 [Rhodotorula paludigena]|uniref:Proteophosphoglycan ppg4 n=1 Tax=Rhodotorula paludigena TaxID=86838 RepID=A0AAV5GCU7_9BASI|nr:hypothetical protein Rhopal_000519-T1 [Rhodotorula paludigena]
MAAPPPPPDAPAPLPSPLAFPALASDPEAAPAPPAPAPATSQPGISYAKASASSLPPSTLPTGTSLPPAPSTSRERLQPSQNGRDSPYARPPGAGANGHGGVPQSGWVRTKKKSAGREGAAKGAHQANGKGADGAAQQGQAQGRPRTVPGMPPSMIPAPASGKKGSHSRTPSSSAPAAAPAAPADPNAPPAIGKKRRQSLRKVLPPTSSKLSPFAASFEFAPRASTGSSSSSSSDEAPPAAAAANGSLLSASEQRDVRDTVASAGAQGDEFRAKSLAQADAEGAAEASAPHAGAQSASPNKPTAVSGAEEAPRGGVEGEKATLEPEQAPREARPLGAFLAQAFEQASGEFAPLVVPAQNEATAADKASHFAGATEVRQIRGAVQESPVADVAWREKRGWWQDGFDYDAEHALGASAAAEPAKAAPVPVAAVEPAQADKYEPLLHFPPWKPSAASDVSVQPTAREAVAPEEVTPLSAYLGSAFSDRAQAQRDVPTSVEEVVTSSSSSAPAAPPASAPLASFLSSSFSTSQSGWTAFESVDEVRAEALARNGPGAVPASEIPTSAEAVAAQPTLDDVLDVDGIEDGKVVEGKKRGWWSDDFDGGEGKDKRTELFSSGEKRAIRETVATAGAQGDEFRSKSLAQADAEGADAVAGTSASAQSARVSKPQGLSGAREEDGESAQQQAQRPGTPLGQYLGQAFSAEPTPSSEFPPELPAAATASSSTSTSSSTPKPAPAPAAPRSASASPPPPPPGGSNSADSAPSLTLALASAWHTAPWSRKIWAVIASLAINVGLPFVNGVMLGFGELFARNVIGVRLGWPLSSSSAPAQQQQPQRANTSGLGLRAAGSGPSPNVGRDVPGHAAAKTAAEAAGEAVREAA